jgi:4-amino-4-deoxy-L-arabinose transferase-like glycosyltransferase
LVIISDQELLQRSVEPAHDLFPVMRRAAVMSPLVVLLVLVPGLLAFHSYRIDELSAWFGLQCLGKTSLISDSSNALISQPPLVRWLYTGLLSLIGHWSSSLVLFSVFSTSCMLFVAYRLTRKVCNPRYAIVFCFLLAFHAVIIKQIQLIEAPAFPMLFALLTIWCYLGHIQSETGIASYKLLCGGISLGICLLSGGALALGVLLMLGLYIINPVDLPRSRSGSSDLKRLPVLKQAVRVWKSLFVLALTGFAVGGWWELMAASQIDGFWGNWFAGPGQPIISLYWKTEFYPTYFLRDIISSMGFLMGFALFGLFHAIKRVLKPDGNQKDIAWLRLVLIWLLCGLLFWWGVQYLPQMKVSSRAMWKMFLIIPMLAIVTWEFQQIALRRVSFPTVLAVFTVGVLSVIFVSASQGDTLSPRVSASFLQQLIILGLSLIMVLWYSHRFKKENGHRVVEIALVIALSCLHIVYGVYSVPKPNPAGERLLQFEHQLRLTQNVSNCVLVSKSDPPLELTFLLFYLWGDINLKQVQGTVLPQDLDFPEVAKTDPPSPTAEKQVIIRWGVTPVSLRNILNAGFILKPVASPDVYKQKELQADLINRSPQGF